MVNVRVEQITDVDVVHQVNAMAFGRENEALIVDQLRDREVSLISLVAEIDKQVVGHALFSPVDVVDGTAVSPAVALGPIAVLPDYQNQGIGGALIQAGLTACLEAGHKVVFVLGHPGYYPHFGFHPAKPHGITCEFPVPDEVFMVVELVDGTLANLQGKVVYQPEFRSG